MVWKFLEMKDDYAVNRPVVDLSLTLMAKEIKSSDASANEESLLWLCIQQGLDLVSIGSRICVGQ